MRKKYKKIIRLGKTKYLIGLNSSSKTVLHFILLSADLKGAGEIRNAKKKPQFVYEQGCKHRLIYRRLTYNSSLEYTHLYKLYTHRHTRHPSHFTPTRKTDVSTGTKKKQERRNEIEESCAENRPKSRQQCSVV
jgi:hypothetical protein